MAITKILAETGTCARAQVDKDSFCTNLPTAGANPSNLHGLLQIALGTMAVVAVLIIVISALNFVTSEGDPQKAAKAKDAIIYALIGLVIAVSAEFIVTFVLKDI